MKIMKKLKVNRIGEQKIKEGYCILDADSCLTPSFSDDLAEVYSEKDRFLGTAYLSVQNKGIGWFISSKKVSLEPSFFQSLFETAKEHRQHFFDSETTTAFRLFNQDGDGFGGLTVDIYNEYAVFSWYNTYVFSLKKHIVAAFQEVFPEIVGAYEKIRFKGLEYESEHLFGKEAPETFLIKENGIAYSVFLDDGLMTGIFLDQHEVRGRLAAGLATGKRVLNLFSYTAAFSVAAAMGGAIHTTSVDLAKRSKELSRAHFEANGIELENHNLVVMDVFSYFKYAKRHGLVFDVIVLDPPSFARNKKQTFSVAKDYHKLVTQAMDILSPNGIVIASTNASNVTSDKFKRQLEKGLNGRRYDFLESYRLPSDFKYNKNDESSNYLKVFTIQVQK
ncbi:class I SAM-dependent rRNA methyltransferase [Streptococcus cameli]